MFYGRGLPFQTITRIIIYYYYIIFLLLAQSTVVKIKINNNLGSRNGLIHFTLIPMGKIVSVYEHLGWRTASRNELNS
jgi:hypothetical protein